MGGRLAKLSRGLRSRAACFRRAKGGASAVEFAILSPVFFLIFGVTVDFGGVLFVNFNLNNALSSATNYAVLNASTVGTASDGSLASNLAVLIANNRANWVTDATIVVNNGSAATTTNGSTTTSGTTSSSCYCPSVSGSTVTWGSAVSCGTTCSGGGLAGKFVMLTARRAYQPMFSTYGIVRGGTLSESAFVQVQ